MKDRPCYRPLFRPERCRWFGAWCASRKLLSRWKAIRQRPFTAVVAQVVRWVSPEQIDFPQPWNKPR
jgi:hypothetical protein